MTEVYIAYIPVITHSYLNKILSEFQSKVRNFMLYYLLQSLISFYTASSSMAISLTISNLIYTIVF